MAAAYDMLDRMEAVLDKLTEDYAECEQTTHELRERSVVNMPALTKRVGASQQGFAFVETRCCEIQTNHNPCCEMCWVSHLQL
jgi:hypothetical protein